jgi:hypothetical protein
MANRILLLVTCVALVSGCAGENAGLSSADDLPGAADVGDFVAVEMTGDAALKYSRISTRPIADENRSGLTIQLMAEVHKTSDAAIVQLVHHAETNINSSRFRLTLTGTLPTEQIIAESSPAGTLVSASPTAAGTPTGSEIKTLRVRLNDLEGFKLQRWQLIEEIVD